MNLLSIIDQRIVYLYNFHVIIHRARLTNITLKCLAAGSLHKDHAEVVQSVLMRFVSWVGSGVSRGYKTAKCGDS